MKKILPAVALLCHIVAYAQQPIVFQENSNIYSIVIPYECSTNDLHAAQELQRYLHFIFGTELKIVNDVQYNGDHAIFIGEVNQSYSLRAKYGSEIRDDGFLLHTDGNNLYIFGHAPKSALYGVYHLLENYLHYSYTAPNSGTYTHLQEAKLQIHDLQNPSFRYRETLQNFPNISQEYADWHKLHNRKDMQRDWGMFVHTFDKLIPAGEYFDRHPEWFSEIEGKRIKDSQLCLSNPDVLEELCRNLKKRIEKDPNKEYWSVSQNDNENPCTCAACRHLDSLYGGRSGTMIWFVNQVARRFPDKTISTLAYQQTRRPPTNIRPEPNVNIMFCSIECQRQVPIAENPVEQRFVKDLEGWVALTDNIFLWDYVVQFKHYLDPFPNLHVLQPNLQLFHQYDVPMIFEQGTSGIPSENTEWRTFLLAHLMWNVKIDVDSLRTVFLSNYYGANRAPIIAHYMDTMTNALIRSGQVLGIYGYPIDAVNGYLSPAMISYYQSLFAKSYQTKPYKFYDPNIKLPDDPNDRLRRLELALDFAILDMSLRDVAPELSYFDLETGLVRPEMRKRLDDFVRDCERFGITYLNESSFKPKDFYNEVLHYIEKRTKPNKAENKNVKILTDWSWEYNPGAPKCLVDGKFGTMDYRNQWLGFEGEDMDVVVDLGQVDSIHEISCDFFFYPLSWIFAPKRVTFYISEDGENWQNIGSVTHENEATLTKTSLVTLGLKNLNLESRYVRIFAESLKTNPEWHRGHGQPCWLFSDELIIR